MERLTLHGCPTPEACCNRSGILPQQDEMMALLGFKHLRIAFGGPALLDGANLQIERGERICLVGRNGIGKSTLLKLIHPELGLRCGPGICFMPLGRPTAD